MHNYAKKRKNLKRCPSVAEREGIWCRNERVGLCEEHRILSHSDARR